MKSSLTACARVHTLTQARCTGINLSGCKCELKQTQRAAKERSRGGTGRREDELLFHSMEGCIGERWKQPPHRAVVLLLLGWVGE